MATWEVLGNFRRLGGNMKLGRYIARYFDENKGVEARFLHLVEISPSERWGCIITEKGEEHWMAMKDIEVVESLDEPSLFCGECPYLKVMTADQTSEVTDLVCGKLGADLFVKEGEALRHKKCPLGEEDE